MYLSISIDTENAEIKLKEIKFKKKLKLLQFEVSYLCSAACKLS